MFNSWGGSFVSRSGFGDKQKTLDRYRCTHSHVRLHPSLHLHQPVLPPDPLRHKTPAFQPTTSNCPLLSVAIRDTSHPARLPPNLALAFTPDTDICRTGRGFSSESYDAADVFVRKLIKRREVFPLLRVCPSLAKKPRKSGWHVVSILPSKGTIGLCVSLPFVVATACCCVDIGLLPRMRVVGSSVSTHPHPHPPGHVPLAPIP